MRILYHGGTDVVTCPKVSFGRDGLDFGMGFYATELLEQAWKWADRISRQRAEKAAVSMYSFDDEKAAKKYRMLRFDAYDSDWQNISPTIRYVS